MTPRSSGAIVPELTTRPFRSTVTLTGSFPVFATTAAKSNKDHTGFAVTVGQKSHPMYVLAAAASWQVLGSSGPFMVVPLLNVPPPAPPTPPEEPPEPVSEAAHPPDA